MAAFFEEHGGPSWAALRQRTLTLLQQEREQYRAAPEDAEALRSSNGQAPVDTSLDAIEVAATTLMVRGLLTPAEAEYCRSRPDPAEHVAVRLAAKEAVYKALQGSDAARGIGWRDIEVTRAADGRPDVVLTGIAASRAKELKVRRVLLSLSHTHQAAVAIAVLSTD